MIHDPQLTRCQHSKIYIIQIKPYQLDKDPPPQDIIQKDSVADTAQDLKNNILRITSLKHYV